MFLLDEPVPFREAVKQLTAKELMPTNMTSGQLATLNQEILRQSFFSAQTTIDGLLQRYKTGVESIVNPTTGMSKDRETEQNPSGFVTSGYDPSSLRAFIKNYLEEISYAPEAGKEGTVQDLSSDKRIDLVVKTNVQLAHGAGRFIQQNADADVVDLWPALVFPRFVERKQPRHWEQRWRIAAGTAGDVDAARVLEETGRMAALKESGIWQALGDGAGGYDDTLGNPYPPFAFNSGMWTEEMSRSEAEDVGLLGKGEAAAPARFDLGSLFNFTGTTS